MKSTLPFLSFCLLAMLFFSACENNGRKPTAEFEFEIANCESPFIVRFTNLSEDATEFQWDFGDGTTSEERDPAHVYRSEGPFEVKLNVWNEKEKTDEFSMMVDPNNLEALVEPTFQFGINACAPPYQVKIYQGAAPNQSFLWELPNGTTSTDQQPEFTMQYPGVYLVRVFTWQCEDTLEVEHQLIIEADSNDIPLQARFKFEGPYKVENRAFLAGTPILLTNKCKNYDRFEFDLGDGNTSTFETIEKTYPAGEYEIAITAWCGNHSERFVKVITFREPEEMRITSFGLAKFPEQNYDPQTPGEGAPDVFFRLYENDTTEVFQTYTQDNIPIWSTPFWEVNHLVTGVGNPFRLQVLDEDANGQEELIGEIEFVPQELYRIGTYPESMLLASHTVAGLRVRLVVEWL